MVVATAVSEAVAVQLAVGVAGERVGAGVRLREHESLRELLELRVEDGERDRVVSVRDGEAVGVAEVVWAAEAVGDALGLSLWEGVRDVPVSELLHVTVRLGVGGEAVRLGLWVRV